MNWSQLDAPGKIEAIKAVYVHGDSAAKLAAKAGAPSRHAVIGVYGRQPAAMTGYPLGPRGSRGDGAVKSVAAPRPRPLSRINPNPKPAIACTEVLPPRNLTLMQNEGCRWPTARDGEHLFCGHPKTHGSYCAGHYRMAFERGTEGERSADRVLKAAA